MLSSAKLLQSDSVNVYRECGKVIRRMICSLARSSDPLLRSRANGDSGGAILDAALALDALEIVEDRRRRMKDLFLRGDLPRVVSISDALRLRPTKGIFHTHAGIDDSG